ncbi:hypothetical protein GKC49_32110, partial [Pantoea agglomerans]|nr:hypothetical protein [Pantoea agglomerans]
FNHRLIITIEVIFDFPQLYQHMAKLREIEDNLYRDYQTVIEGRKELQLNRSRAQQVYDTVYQEDARAWRHHIVRTEMISIG